jgi:hypothetical protein
MRIRPAKFVHVVYRTRRFEQMVRWYETVSMLRSNIRIPHWPFWPMTTSTIGSCLPIWSYRSSSPAPRTLDIGQWSFEIRSSSGLWDIKKRQAEPFILPEMRHMRGYRFLDALEFASENISDMDTYWYALRQPYPGVDRIDVRQALGARRSV